MNELQNQIQQLKNEMKLFERFFNKALGKKKVIIEFKAMRKKTKNLKWTREEANKRR